MGVVVTHEKPASRAAAGEHEESRNSDDQPLLALRGRRVAFRRIEHRYVRHCLGHSGKSRQTIAATEVKSATLVPPVSG